MNRNKVSTTISVVFTFSRVEPPLLCQPPLRCRGSCYEASRHRPVATVQQPRISIVRRSVLAAVTWRSILVDPLERSKVLVSRCVVAKVTASVVHSDFSKRSLDSVAISRYIPVIANHQSALQDAIPTGNHGRVRAFKCVEEPS